MGRWAGGEPGQCPAGPDQPATPHLGAAAIVTTEAGYALAISPGDVDVIRFEQLVAKGRRLSEAGEAALASVALGEALGLRRGEPLAEFAYAGFADAERARLDELALVAVEARAGADLDLGRHADLVGELEAACRRHPLRERLWELLIVSLYRSGRQAEALGAYTAIRGSLVDELGIDPGRGAARTSGPHPGPGSVAGRSQAASGPGGGGAGCPGSR